MQNLPDTLCGKCSRKPFVISVIGVESIRGQNIVVILKKQKLTVMSVTTDGLV